ncbi:MAG: PadR family transcriptional regulator [Thomasclavelia sp.]
MRTLKYAILGLLMRKTMSGYDLNKEFNTALTEFWSAKHSQIYPELKKLLAENLVEYHVEISGDVLEKKIYNITEKGKQEFLNWLNRDDMIDPTPKDVFRLRMYFSENLKDEEVLKLLDSQINQHQNKLAHLEDVNNSFEKIPQKGTYEFTDYIVLQSAIMRENNYIQWLNLCKDFYKK